MPPICWRRIVRPRAASTRTVEGPDAERASGLLGGEADQIDQDQRGSLCRRQPSEGPDDRVAIVDRSHLVPRRRGHADSTADGERDPAPAVAEQVHAGPVEVSHRVVELPNPAPPLPDLDEGVLRELLRLVPVPSHQPQGAEQRPAVLGEEVVEGGAGGGWSGLGVGLELHGPLHTAS